MATQVEANFQATQLFFKHGDEEATFADLPLPGIGASGREALSGGNASFDGGISNAAQVVGYFMRLNGDVDAMRALLVDKCGCDGPAVDKYTLPALQTKCEAFVSPTVDTLTSPRLSNAMSANAGKSTTQVKAAFMAKQLSWADDFDSNSVPGVGAQGRERLRSQDGIANGVQLVGLYMMLNGDDDEFTEHLLGCGMRTQEIHSPNGTLSAVREKASAIVMQQKADAEALKTGHSWKEKAHQHQHQAGGSKPSEPESEPSLDGTKRAVVKDAGGGGAWLKPAIGLVVVAVALQMAEVIDLQELAGFL